MVAVLLSIMFAFDGPPLTDLTIAGRGPFRFVVDTGAESSVATPEVARLVGLRPEYRVEVATVNGSLLAPANAAVPVDHPAAPGSWDVEMLWYPLDAVRRAAPQAQGVLGMSALRGRSLLLDLRSGEAHFDLAPAEPGVALPFTWLGGRLAVDAVVDGEPRRLILDSGASHLVLFGDLPAHGRASLATSQGERSVPVTRVRELTAGPAAWQGLTAAVVPRPEGRAEDGLLPAALFDWIWIHAETNRLMGRPHH